ncbi:hypothetical protein [Haploplasma axanthum]|uniref:Uncharacterized protein n=1 Tax=Haploplasma axanthum TaxID=29552 RepID=A0A449BBA2_HAPAX|nr:hypothetical protein [Haploplasma axanthum]VEU79603.1 Uncharacterised protein [Haploplasma axanthum]
MKLLLAPIKILLWIIGIILLLVTILLVLMHKSVKVPDITVSKDLETIVIEELDELIDDTNNDKTLNIGISENTANIEIKKQLLKQFTASTNPEYLYEDENIKFQGAWIEYKENTINVISGVHINAKIMTYKTSVSLSFEIVNTKSEIVLKLKKINVGNLPLAWLVSMSPNILKTFTGQDLNQMVTNILGDIGTFDIKKRELKVDLYKLADQANENKELLTLLLDVLFENDLVEFGIKDDNGTNKLGLTLDLNKIKNDKAAVVISAVDKINSEIELEIFLRNKALQSLISQEESISFSALDLNKVIDYSLANSLALENGVLSKQVVYKDYEIIIGVFYIEVKDNEVYLNVPIKIGKDNNYFKTTIIANVGLEKIDSDLGIEIKNLNIGEINFDNTEISALLTMFATEEMGFDNNKFLLQDFFAKFDQQGITFTTITINNDLIHFNYDFSGLSDVLDNLIGNTVSPVIAAKATEILGLIQTNSDISTAVDEMIDLIDNLSEEEKNEILDLINNLI